MQMLSREMCSNHIGNLQIFDEMLGRVEIVLEAASVSMVSPVPEGEPILAKQ